MGQFCNYYYYYFYTCSSGAPDVERSQDQQLDGQSEFWFGVQNFFVVAASPTEVVCSASSSRHEHKAALAENKGTQSVMA